MNFTSPWILVPLMIVGLLVLIWILKWLWNTTMPDVFGLKTITYFQAFKILVLSMILSGSGSSLLSISNTDTVTMGNATTTKTVKFGMP
jgi:hypothetical protein